MTDELVKRLPQLSDEEKTARALAACDELAETWAIEADLPDMAIAVAGKPDADSRIVALAKQAFIEGAYRAFCQRQDAIDQLVEAQAVIERLTTERDNAWNGAIEAAAGVIKSEEQRILARQDGKSPAVDTIIRTLAAKLPDVEIAIRALKKTETQL